MGVNVYASRRHPHAVVMAPALTETGQTQSFNSLSTSPLNLLDGCDLTTSGKSKPKRLSQDFRFKLFNLAVEETKQVSNGLTQKRGTPLRPLEVVNSAEGSRLAALPKTLNGGDSSMSISAPMGDQSDNMGLLKSNAACTLSDNQENLAFLKGNDVDRLLAEMPAPNVDELMRVISTMDGEGTDTGEFQLTGADIEEGLLMGDVDMMTGFVDEGLVQDPGIQLKDTVLKEKLDEELKRQFELERNAMRLQRRLKKLQARAFGKHTAGELIGVLMKALRMSRHASDAEPITRAALSKFVDKLITSSHAQGQVGMRYRPFVRYFGSGSLEQPLTQDAVPGAILPKLPTEVKQDLQQVARQLASHLSLIQRQMDSDATDSSSGGDSCDESVSYDNNLRHYHSLKKRSYRRWQLDRGRIASRWTWLVTQITELDFRIRQFTEHIRKYNAMKGVVDLEDHCPSSSSAKPAPSLSVNGYHGTLPGGVLKSDDGINGAAKIEDGPNGTLPTVTDPAAVCARARPYCSQKFQNRALFRLENLHLKTTSPKMARASNVRCWCQSQGTHCVICTGRPDPTHPTSWPGLGPTPVDDRLAVLDPAYHPVLSIPDDVPLELHLDSIMRLHEWQSRVNRCSYKYSKYPKDKTSNSEPRLKKQKHVIVEDKRKRHKHTTALLTAKLLKKKLSTTQKRRRDMKNSECDAPIPSLRIKKARKQSSPSGGDSGDEGDLYVATPTTDQTSPGDTTMSVTGSATGATERTDDARRRGREDDSYDINNIVIPYSMAAATRVQLLPYKEIPTPKWRLLEDDHDTRELVDENKDDLTEDLSMEAVLERHARYEDAERKQFSCYIKLPMAGRGRTHRRADSRAESSGANTPDPMSPMNPDHGDSPITTPPATPLAADETGNAAAVRRRTISSSRLSLREKLERAATESDRCLTPEIEDEVLPYEPRMYPLDEKEYLAMIAEMPAPLPQVTQSESCRTRRNALPVVDKEDGERPDYRCTESPESPSSSSTISALEDGDEDPDDPNDPEWREMEDKDEFRYRGRR